MSGMIGADTDGLRKLAGSMRQSAQQLEGIGTSLKNTPRTVWIGSDSQSFFSSVDTSLLAQLSSVAEVLTEAGQTLERNATAQDYTSATLEGTSGGVGVSSGEADGGQTGGGGSFGIRAYRPGFDLADVAETVRDGGGFLLDGMGKIADVAEWADKTMPWAKTLGRGEAIIDTVQLGIDLAGGKWDQVGWNGFRSLLTLPGGAIGIVADVGLDVYEAAVPISGERQDAVMESYQMRQFGTTDLSPEQAAQQVEHYSGVTGYLNMLGDSMLEATENPKNPVTGFIRMAGDGVADAYIGISDFFGGKK